MAWLKRVVLTLDALEQEEERQYSSPIVNEIVGRPTGDQAVPRRA